MDGDAVRGELVAEVAGCGACHTAKGGAPFAGGWPIETKFGIFYGSNLTPDPDAGIGRWSGEDFARALRRGRSPEGRPYPPAFPYTSFSGLSDQDIADLWAYLRTIPADPTPDRPHEARAIATGRLPLTVWRWLSFRPAKVAEDRGTYLVEAVAHCGECHTPRDGLGRVRKGRAMAGNGDPPAPAPNVTPGALVWTVEDWTGFFETGMLPDGDAVGGEMARVVRATARLPEADRRAMAAVMVAVKARGRPEEAAEDGGEDW